MTLEVRTLKWTGWPYREFRQLRSRSSAPRVWKVWVADNVVETLWGQLNGKLQHAQENVLAVNEGKSNYLSPQEAALNRAKRLIELKTREGYREYKKETPLDPTSASEIDFSSTLPKELCFWKPVNSTEGKMLEKANSGRAWFARKRNGMAMVLCHHTGGIHMYSRRMLRQHDDEGNTLYSWNDRFPHIISKAEEIMPSGSILLGELLVEVDGKERFDLAQSFIKSLTEQAIADQQQLGAPFFYCWDIPFWDGEELAKVSTVRTRYELIHEVADYPIVPVEVYPEGFFRNTAQAIEFAKAKNWEGFVVVDPDGVFGDRAYNFKGKPDRPPCMTKLKPAYEDDFIALWDPEKGQGERSTKGSRSGGIKSVSLYQYDSQGRLIFISNVSSGLTKEHLAAWASPTKFPMVWQVEYTSRRYVFDGDDTNALDFPRFKNVRTDKAINECINPRL